MVKAQELQAGDLIDIAAIADEVDLGPLDGREHEKYFAEVEWVSLEGEDEVMVGTNQHTITLPVNFEVELYNS